LPILLESGKNNLSDFYMLKMEKNFKKIKNVKNAFLFLYKNVCKRLLHLWLMGVTGLRY